MRSLWSRTPLLLLILYSGVLLYGTLIPFSFTWHPGREQVNSRRRAEWVPFTRPSPVRARDTALNLVMFIPFGVLLTLALNAGRGRVLASVARSGLLGFLLSLVIEATQYFIPARFPSSSDLVLNTLGAALGALVTAAWLKRVPQLKRQDLE